MREKEVNIVMAFAYAWLEAKYPDKKKDKRVREAVSKFASQIERMMYDEEKQVN